MPRLGDRVFIQQGFQFKGGRDLGGRDVVSAKKRAGWQRAYLRANDGYPIYGTPTAYWADYRPENLRRANPAPGHPQVIVNYAPASRKPWRIKAAIDKMGAAVASRFIVFRPRPAGPTLDVLWAILNSPIANAYAFATSGKRQTLPKEWRLFPIPRLSPEDATAITDAVQQYRERVRSRDAAFFGGTDDAAVRDALVAMDAEVLRVYDLSPKLERQLLSLFDGVERVGVGLSVRRLPTGW